MVSLQQSTDREYSRLRQADTRYRLFFHASSEAVLVVEVSNGLRVVEANPAAATLFEAPAQELMRAKATDFLAQASRPVLEAFVGAVVAGARPSDVTVLLKDRPDELMLSASLFRQAGVSYAVLRVWSAVQKPTAETKRSSRVQAVIDAIADGFVVVGEDRRILSANPAFCELVQQANEKQVVGEAIDRWLGRAGVDINIMMANLREHGSIKNFSTILRSDVGAPQEALVTGVAVLEGKLPCIGFVIRVTRARLFAAPTNLPHSVEQLRELVGRVSLKELVRQSADLIERMCIEAALDVSGNNRASAAQLLGLSRQGLYSKLRRHGMGGPEHPS
jgi:transcriptional regulator PpsR